MKGWRGWEGAKHATHAYGALVFFKKGYMSKYMSRFIPCQLHRGTIVLRSLAGVSVQHNGKTYSDMCCALMKLPFPPNGKNVAIPIPFHNSIPVEHSTDSIPPLELTYKHRLRC